MQAERLAINAIQDLQFGAIGCTKTIARLDQIFVKGSKVQFQQPNMLTFGAEVS